MGLCASLRDLWFYEVYKGDGLWDITRGTRMDQEKLNTASGSGDRSWFHRNEGETLGPHNIHRILAFSDVLGETEVRFGLEVVESLWEMWHRPSMMAKNGVRWSNPLRRSDPRPLWPSHFMWIMFPLFKWIYAPSSTVYDMPSWLFCQIT